MSDSRLARTNRHRSIHPSRRPLHYGYACACQRVGRKHCRFGDTMSDLLAAYPHLTEADIHAALKFAAEAVNHTDFIPLAG